MKGFGDGGRQCSLSLALRPKGPLRRIPISRLTPRTGAAAGTSASRRRSLRNLGGDAIGLTLEIVRRRATLRFRLERPRRGRVKRNLAEILRKARHGRRYRLGCPVMALWIVVPRLMPDQATREQSIINSPAEPQLSPARPRKPGESLALGSSLFVGRDAHALFSDFAATVSLLLVLLRAAAPNLIRLRTSSCGAQFFECQEVRLDHLFDLLDQLVSRRKIVV